MPRRKRKRKPTDGKREPGESKVTEDAVCTAREATVRQMPAPVPTPAPTLAPTKNNKEKKKSNKKERASNLSPAGFEKSVLPLPTDRLCVHTILSFLQPRELGVALCVSKVCARLN